MSFAINKEQTEQIICRPRDTYRPIDGRDTYMDRACVCIDIKDTLSNCGFLTISVLYLDVSVN